MEHPGTPEDRRVASLFYGVDFGSILNPDPEPGPRGEVKTKALGLEYGAWSQIDVSSFMDWAFQPIQFETNLGLASPIKQFSNYKIASNAWNMNPSSLVSTPTRVFFHDVYRLVQFFRWGSRPQAIACCR